MGVSGLPSVSSYYHCANNIISVPFLDPVEVLVCDSFGCEYWNPKHDIKLKIPDGAIPSGLVAHIEIAVALYGPFLFLKDVFQFLLYCGCAFKKILCSENHLKSLYRTLLLIFLKKTLNITASISPKLITHNIQPINLE